VIYVILGKFTKATAEDFALDPDERPDKRSAEDREDEIRAVMGHPRITGALEHVVWTLGEYDVVITINVPSPEKGAAAALALATRMGIGTTTLTGFETESLQVVMDDGGYGSHGRRT
jgi:uncharacterized protein with GYD domain